MFGTWQHLRLLRLFGYIVSKRTENSTRLFARLAGGRWRASGGLFRDATTGKPTSVCRVRNCSGMAVPVSVVVRSRRRLSVVHDKQWQMRRTLSLPSSDRGEIERYCRVVVIRFRSVPRPTRCRESRLHNRRRIAIAQEVVLAGITLSL